MPEPDRDLQQCAPLVVEHDALPLAERRRAAPQVDDDVEHAARARRARACPGRDGSGSGFRAACRCREREWLSCTNSVGMPCAAHVSARNVSTKKPRSSPCTAGARRTRPSSRVSRRRITTGRRLESHRRKTPRHAEDRHDAPGRPRPPDTFRVHLRTLRRVLPLAEGRRAVRRRPSRRGRLPHRRGARAARQHVLLDRRALQPGARLRGLPGAAGGGARGVPPPPPHPRSRNGTTAPRRCSASTSRRSSRPSPPITSTSRTPRAASAAPRSTARSRRSPPPSGS